MKKSISHTAILAPLDHIGCCRRIIASVCLLPTWGDRLSVVGRVHHGMLAGEAPHFMLPTRLGP